MRVGQFVAVLSLIGFCATAFATYKTQRAVLSSPIEVTL